MYSLGEKGTGGEGTLGPGVTYRLAATTHSEPRESLAIAIGIARVRGPDSRIQGLTPALATRISEKKWSWQSSYQPDEYPAKIGDSLIVLYESETLMATTIDAPLQWVENVATLRLPEQADRHLQQLMDRNNEGLLTEHERLIWRRWLN